MSQQDLEKWNKRYAEDSYRKGNPVTLLEEWLPKLPRGKSLDVACGMGRNAISLAQAGYQVDAIDISAQGLKKAAQNAKQQNLDINWIEHDFDQPYDFDIDYNLIVVMWYVNLPLITRLCNCLAPGGVLLCEEHLVTDEDVIGPGNPDFRVKSGTLRQAVSQLEILHYSESVDSNQQAEKVASAQVVARK